ncbi:MAG TPA: valine--tRNA ligase [Chloroflexota bacterium]|nr:valine--tRNA ligase [Chloroflexota bacterium]
MTLGRYDPAVEEPRLAAMWQENGTYHYLTDRSPVYSIDTPPPTVSGYLHLGHVYSYSHADFMARYFRMQGRNVYYPMGYDDNGLPTERLVERRLGKTAEEMGRPAFIAACLELSREYEREYEELWQRLGLSIDWRHTYRTIDDLARKTCQLNFIELYGQGTAYRRQAPTIWCPTCHTAIAQAEEKDIERRGIFYTLAFQLDGGGVLRIATTRPELLPACVAVFVHPDDTRYRGIVGRQARVPLFGQEVPIMTDEQADPEKGTGAVMCCTFGDTVDVAWWHTHNLPLREALDRHGRMTPLAEQFAGLTVPEARQAVVQALRQHGAILAEQPVEQTVRAHERCDTPVEFIVTRQWFIRVLDNKETFLQIGDAIDWRPPHMKARYREWVEGLSWDWCISRQRYYGVPFPVWFCSECGAVIVADEDQLPVDPTTEQPPRPCSCGGTAATAEEDVMDTWATSSLSPQIAGGQLSNPALYAEVFPMSLRPQAHEIIRTWAFYTIVMSHYRFGATPWKEVLISGWGLAPGGTEKISKSRGGGPMAPMEMLQRYSADALRYWAASTGLGKDSYISEEKIAAGAKLVTKLWNVTRFAARFLEGYEAPAAMPPLSPADRWTLSRLQRLVQHATSSFEAYEYAAAKNDTEIFFWRDLSDNYLEMAKKRLYDDANPGHRGACYTLYHTLRSVNLLFAPILPFTSEEVHGALFAAGGSPTVHRGPWPEADQRLLDGPAERAGEALVEIATAVRRHKSDRNLSLGAELERLHVTVTDPALLQALAGAEDDIASVTRAREVTIGAEPAESLQTIWQGEQNIPITVAL